jgi:hypothetical protein
MEDVPEELLTQPKWKTKLREKLLGNMEISFQDMHLRCEVFEGGLDFCHTCKAVVGDSSVASKTGELPADQRAFAFGMTIESMYVRSANDKWEVGSSKLAPAADDESTESLSIRASSLNSSFHSQGTQSSSIHSSISSINGEPRFQNKIAEVNNLSVYWDDDPPLLISETPALRNNNASVAANKLQSRIAAAMDAMVLHQDPGSAIKRTLTKSEVR